MEAMMASAKAGVKIPRVGNYGKIIPVGTVLSAALIVLTSPSVANAAEIPRPDWRNSTDATKGNVECATFRRTITVESWWNLRSSVWEGVDRVQYGDLTRSSSWVEIGEMTAKEATMFETDPKVISQDWVLGYTIYNVEMVICRFNGNMR